MSKIRIPGQGDGDDQQVGPTIGERLLAAARAGGARLAHMPQQRMAPAPQPQAMPMTAAPPVPTAQPMTPANPALIPRRLPMTAAPPSMSVTGGPMGPPVSGLPAGPMTPAPGVQDPRLMRKVMTPAQQGISAEMGGGNAMDRY